MKFFTLFFIAFICIFFTTTTALTVHLVSHTHDDVGWLKTVDQYFSGQNNTIQHTNVGVVLDTVIQALAQNPERKFSYVEQAFFTRWWNQQNDDIKALTKQLYQSGQLEFINGGWCMHDEAAAHYVDMIDQTTVGHKFLLDTFGAIPTIGWQIDPFGHSSTQAALLSAEVGFDALFFARIDYQDFAVRIANKELEMIWRASPSLGPQAQVFTGAFQGGYGPPGGFCWDALDCSDEPVQDDPTLEDYNVESRVNDFVNAALQQAGGTAGDLETMNIMWTLGSDFMYEAAHEWFKNIDKIIKYVNLDGRVKAVHSTPSQYVKAKNAEPVQWTVKTDDFFPYADGADSYWTGYFTSRPALKRYIRESSAFLQTVRQFEVLSAANGSASQRYWQSQGVVQHHDSVSGTSKQHVAYDYAKRISIGMEAGAEFTTGIISDAMGLDFSLCFLRNISICPVTQQNPTVLAAYWNPQARNRTEVLIVPISSSSATVYDANGVIPSQILLIPTNQASTSDSAKYAVAFETELMSYAASGIIISSQSHHMSTMSKKPETTDATVLSIKNQFIQLNFDSNTGLLVNFTDLTTGTSYPFTQEIAYYESYQQQNQQDSGAYIFRPASDTAVPVRENGNVKTTVINNGAIVQEVQQVFSSWATQIVRLRSNSRHVEFEWTVGPVDISDNQGKEVIVRYNTTLASNGVFYTDSNGREVIPRVRNQRPTWKWDPTQLVAGNYYPVNGAIGLDDGETALVVNVERAQGCGSLADGSLECMVHRRILQDDGRGVGEPLNETMGGILNDGTRLGEGLVITGTHYISLVPSDIAYDVARPLQDKVFQPPVPFFSPYSMNNVDVEYSDALIKLQNSFGDAQFRLNSNVQFPINAEVMTVQAWDNGQVLVRLSHQFGINEGSVYNVPVTVDLQDVFSSTVSGVTELSLTANQPVGSHKPLVWNTTSVTSSYQPVRVPLAGTSVTLNPLQIRTFAVTLTD